MNKFRVRPPHLTSTICQLAKLHISKVIALTSLAVAACDRSLFMPRNGFVISRNGAAINAPFSTSSS